MQKTFLNRVIPALILSLATTAQPQTPGSVVAWGANFSGQTDVPVAAQSGVVAIAAGGNHTVALKNDGSVVAWGNDCWDGQTMVPAAAQSGVIAIAAGGGHTVALKNDGTVIVWGLNDSGQTNVPADLSGVTAIAAGGICDEGGGSQIVALKSNGSVVAWGYNGDGQTEVPVTAQSEVRAIAAGLARTVALRNDGSVVAWGRNGYEQTNVPVAAQSGATAIASGYEHTLALKEDGTVVAWGGNSFGQVTGTPTTGEPYSVTASPVTLGGQVLNGITATAAGGYHTVALKNDGTVVAWGLNDYGETTVPASLNGVTAIAAGGFHTVALIGTGRVTSFALTVRPSGNELVLSWPTNAMGFTLQSTPQLTPPVTWVDSTNPPAVIDAQFTVTNVITGSAQFYRLRMP